MSDPISQFSGEYRFLSNFYPSPIPLGSDGLAVDAIAPTVEHAFQASKTLVEDEMAWVLAAGSPGEAKRRGRRVTLRPQWDRDRVAVMRDLLRVKFAPGSELAERLKATLPRTLVEGNSWGDRFWGVDGGRGENQLGLLLMEIRADLVLGA